MFDRVFYQKDCMSALKTATKSNKVQFTKLGEEDFFSNSPRAIASKVKRLFHFDEEEAEAIREYEKRDHKRLNKWLSQIEERGCVRAI